MELQRVIQYSDLFPEEGNNLPDVQSFIRGLRREDLCTITANMMARIAGKPFFDVALDPRRGEFDMLRFFLSDKDSDFTQDIINRYTAAVQSLPTDYHGGFIATSKSAVLSFLRLIFSLKPEKNQVLSAQIEKDYLKALLLVNQEVYSASYDENKHSTEPDDLRLAHLLLAYSYANEDVESSNLNDIFRRQLIKSFSLFEFLFKSKESRIKVLRGRFLAHFHIGSWVEYLIPHIMTVYFLKRDSGLLSLKGSGKYGKKARRVIERSCIEKDATIPIVDNPDYSVFRANPYIRMNKHHYAIISQSFVVEHMFNSVYFILKSFRRDAGFLSDDEFRRYYTTEFSQKYMFEGFVKQCLPSNIENAVAGSMCDTILQKARKNGQRIDGMSPPDYYMRLPEGCVIMEYKDALTGAKVKESRDAERLFADIKEKFFENDRGKHKGIAQILDSIESIQKGTFFFDSPPRTTIVYPVLVVDNPVYTMRGMRTVLEHLMREECLKRGLRSDLVRPLILMDVATLKLYSDYFNSNGLVSTFEAYYRHVSLNGRVVQKDIFESLVSFSEYMQDKDHGNMHNVFDRILHEAKPILEKYK